MHETILIGSPLLPDMNLKTIFETVGSFINFNSLNDIPKILRCLLQVYLDLTSVLRVQIYHFTNIHFSTFPFPKMN